jgi:hypothetical protein
MGRILFSLLYEERRLAAARLEEPAPAEAEDRRLLRPCLLPSFETRAQARARQDEG